MADVAYPAVLLAFGRGIALLPTMVGCIQSGLRALTKTFCKVKVLVDAKGNVLTDQYGNPEVKVPNPRIELLFTYLAVWYVMHCPSLMTSAYTSEDFVSFLQKLEHSSWQNTYIFYIRKAIQSDSIISWSDASLAFRIHHMETSSWTSYGQNGYTTLSTSIFCWLISIRHEYLIFRQGDTCTIEPYLQS